MTFDRLMAGVLVLTARGMVRGWAPPASAITNALRQTPRQRQTTHATASELSQRLRHRTAFAAPLALARTRLYSSAAAGEDVEAAIEAKSAEIRKVVWCGGVCGALKTGLARVRVEIGPMLGRC